MTQYDSFKPLFIFLILNSCSSLLLSAVLTQGNGKSAHHIYEPPPLGQFTCQRQLPYFREKSFIQPGAALWILYGERLTENSTGHVSWSNQSPLSSNGLLNLLAKDGANKAITETCVKLPVSLGGYWVESYSVSD